MTHSRTVAPAVEAALEGAVVAVTGASSGLGRQMATELARGGAHVLLATRDAAKTEHVMAGIRGAVPRASLEHVLLDLGSLASVRAAAEAIRRRHARLDVLVNNAGIMGGPRARTADGFESHLGTNHLAHAALVGQLLSLLLATPSSRVVVVSSSTHRLGRLDRDDLHWERRRYSRWGAYAQSKLANLLFMRELDRRLVASGSTTFAVAAHPGVTRTEADRPPRGLPGRLAGGVLARALLAATSHPLEEAALPQLHAATASVPRGSYWGPAGPLQLRGPPAQVSRSRRARDDDDARWLWDRTVELTGVTYDELTP